MKINYRKLIATVTSMALSLSMVPATAMTALAEENQVEEHQAQLTANKAEEDGYDVSRIRNSNYYFAHKGITIDDSNPDYSLCKIISFIADKSGNKLVSLPDQIIKSYGSAEHYASFGLVCDGKVVDVEIGGWDSKGDIVTSGIYYANPASKKVLDISGREWDEIEGKRGVSFIAGVSKSSHNAIIYNTSLNKVKTIIVDKNANRLNGRWDSTAKCYVISDVKTKKSGSIIKEYNKRAYDSKFNYLGKPLLSTTLILTTGSYKGKLIEWGTREYYCLYTGKALTPRFKVKIGKKTLKSGRDYKIIKYKNNKKSGYGQIIIKGAGTYGGMAELDFPIIPRPVVVTNTIPIKGGFKVSWKKMSKSEVSGYRIYYGTNKNDMNVVYKSAKATSATIKGLKSWKTYNVYVQAVSHAVFLGSVKNKTFKVTTR